MAIRQIIRYGDPVLRDISEPVEKIDAEVKELVQNMLETLHRARGFGLAAPQVGVNLRIFIVDLSQVDFDAEPHVFINPIIVEKKGESVGEEGCLSFPGLYFDISRADEIKIEYLNLEGKREKLSASGLAARAILHEYDHLDGILFIDYLSAAQRDLFAGRLKKIKVG